MKEYKSRSLADMAGSAGSMLLFLIFAGCMLIIIASAASTYSRISRSFDSQFGSSASIKYITNKIRAAESAELFDGGIALENDGVISVIYCAEGGIYERSLPSDSAPEAKGGDRIADAGTLEVSELDGLYKVTIRGGGDSSSVMIRKK